MIFGEVSLEEAEGAILAHSIFLDQTVLKKGRQLRRDDLEALVAAGYTRVVVARPGADDVHEDKAAKALATDMAGSHLNISAARTGRCNLTATARGLLVFDRERLDRLNLVDEALTVATLMSFTRVESGQMAATVKIIPFAVSKWSLQRCLALAQETGPILRVEPFSIRRAGLIQTRLPGTKQNVLDKTRKAIDQRLAAFDCFTVAEMCCEHRSEALARSIEELARRDIDILLISGASAIADRCDVVPAGLVAAGGRIEHFGMPVDPGNLLLLGAVAETTVVGIPGCARSLKLNGFDWVLQRLMAGLKIGAADIMTMGAGGLLKEISARPLPRTEAVESPQEASSQRPRIAAVLLAAGRATRMGGPNKLLMDFGGHPLVATSLANLRTSQATRIIVVTGYQADKVEALLNKEDSITVVRNPSFGDGLSTSLQRALAAVPDWADGVLVALGDMPQVTTEVIDRLIGAFDPSEGRAICLPTWHGKRGNPVILARRFFAELQTISGDVGARSLINDYPGAVWEVPMDDLPNGNGILLDIDTPSAFRDFEHGGTRSSFDDQGHG